MCHTQYKNKGQGSRCQPFWPLNVLVLSVSLLKQSTKRVQGLNLKELWTIIKTY